MRVIAAAATMLVVSPAIADEQAGAGDWTGPFAGFSVGAMRSSGEATRRDFEGALLTLDVQNGLFPASIDEPDIAALGGIFLGYNHQDGNVIAGIEVDFSLTDSDARAGFSRIDPNPDPVFFGVNTITGYETALDGLATARLRLGYTVGEALLYGTGGIAFGEVENRFTLALPELGYTSPDWSEDGIRVGYIVGAGLEYRITPRIGVRAELLHYDLEDVTVHASDPTNFPGQTIDYEFDNAGQIGRLGVSLAF